MSARRVTAADRAVGARLRMLRLERGLSQTALAARVGVTYQQVAKYESATNCLTAGRLAALAEKLAVEPGWFFAALDPAEQGALAAGMAARELFEPYSRLDQQQQAAVRELCRRLAPRTEELAP